MLNGLYCVYLKIDILIKAFFIFLVSEREFVWQGIAAEGLEFNATSVTSEILSLPVLGALTMCSS